jgi:hypothetical protein
MWGTQPPNPTGEAIKLSPSFFCHPQGSGFRTICLVDGTDKDKADPCGMTTKKGNEQRRHHDFEKAG